MNCFCFVMLVKGTYYILGVSIHSIVYALLFSMNYPLYMSLVVKTVNAIVRCLSGVMPLSFRNVVTPRRQLIIIATTSLISMAIPLHTQINSSISAHNLNSSRGTVGWLVISSWLCLTYLKHFFAAACLL